MDACPRAERQNACEAPRYLGTSALTYNTSIQILGNQCDKSDVYGHIFIEFATTEQMVQLTVHVLTERVPDTRCHECPGVLVRGARLSELLHLPLLL